MWRIKKRKRGNRAGTRPAPTKLKNGI